MNYLLKRVAIDKSLIKPDMVPNLGRAPQTLNPEDKVVEGKCGGRKIPQVPVVLDKKSDH